MTRLVYLAEALRELADDAEAGRLSGLSVVGLRKDGHPISIVHSPRDRDQATGIFGGLAVNLVIAAMNAGLDANVASRLMEAALREVPERENKHAPTR